VPSWTVGPIFQIFNPRKLQGRQLQGQRQFSTYVIMKELPPVKYVIQKSKKSCPLKAHRRAENTGQRQAAEIVVDGRRPTTGSGQRNRHQGVTRSWGTLAPTTVSGRTGSNRNNQDVAAGRASGMVDDEAQFTEFDGILAPGLVNVADMGESGDAGGAVALTTDQRGRAGRGEGHSQLPSPHPY